MNEKEVKRLSSLRVKKYRDKHRQFLIEGSRLTHEALLAGADVEKIYCLSSAAEDVVNAAASRNIPVETIEDKQLQKISDTVSPSGILGICKISNNDIASVQESETCVFLDSVSDPGNLGTIARTAVWFGIQHIVLSESSADPYNPKVVRAGMGAHFYAKFYPNASAEWLQTCGKEILIADASDNPTDSAGTIPKPWVLVMGSEANGVSEEILSVKHQKISIPKLGEGESLNVAVAAGIILSSLAGRKM